jgi:regulator of protease activity HflC (stomatin/prohibitin superfamily)
MRKVMIAIVVLMALVTVGCRKPYDKPEYREVSTSQTAYLIPLEGDSSKQVKLDSAKAFDQMKVMQKRIQITKRWNQTGRWSHQGEWIPNVSLILVERTPVTQEWTADANSGTNKKNEAIWYESRDSIGVSTGINCTAYIKETDASTFLYFYKANQLSTVMNQEIRNKIQEVLAEFAAGYDLDDLRGVKKEMIEDVRKKVVPFFTERGITITTIGMFGGLEYENPAIQKAIDDVFVAQQLKNVEKAKLSAMADQKKRMEAEGKAEADKARQIAIGQADAKRSEAQALADAIAMKAKAEAQSIELVNNALKDAQSNPMFLQIKKLEVESQRIKKWDGSVPKMTMGGSNSFIPMMQIATE